MRAEKKREIPVNQYCVRKSKQRSCRRTRRYRLGSVRRFINGMLALVMILSLSFGFGSFFSSAHDNKTEVSNEKYYKSIQIKKGDSLWSIAQQYRDTEDSVYEYMDELAEANHLTRKDYCNLQEGDYLVISYSQEEAVY